MGIVRTTDATVEPVTITDCKQQIGISTSVTGHDPKLKRLLKSARQRVERYTGRALLSQSWKLTLDNFPRVDHSGKQVFYLPRPPLISVTSLKYYDDDGVQQTLTDVTDYHVCLQSRPGRIEPAYNTVWPSVRNIAEGVEVIYVAGYGTEASDVPNEFIEAILITVEQLFRFENANELPAAAMALLSSLQVGFHSGAYHVTA